MMTTEQLQHLENRLLRERERTLRALAKFDESKMTQLDDGAITLYPLHLADEGTDTMEQEQQFLMASQEGRRLNTIDNALRALYKEPERFGVCGACEDEIAFERLDIVPWTHLCVECQRNDEARTVRVDAEAA